MALAILFGLLAVFAFVVFAIEVTHFIAEAVSLRFAGANHDVVNHYLIPKAKEVEQELKHILNSMFMFITLGVISYYAIEKFKLIDKVINLIWQINF